MWFKNGLKAQKLLAQGSALGYYDRKTCRPVRAKCCLYPGRCPRLGASALSGRVGHWLLPFRNYLKIRVVSLSLSNSS